jgi:hypothetical protein
LIIKMIVIIFDIHDLNLKYFLCLLNILLISIIDILNFLIIGKALSLKISKIYVINSYFFFFFFKKKKYKIYLNIF